MHQILIYTKNIANNLNVFVLKIKNQDATSGVMFTGYNNELNISIKNF